MVALKAKLSFLGSAFSSSSQATLVLHGLPTVGLGAAVLGTPGAIPSVAAHSFRNLLALLRKGHALGSIRFVMRRAVRGHKIHSVRPLGHLQRNVFQQNPLDLPSGTSLASA